MPDITAAYAGAGHSTGETPMKKVKKTYMIDSVKKEGGVLHASVRLLKSESLTPDTAQKKAASGSNFAGIICDGQGISYISTVQSTMMNFTLVNNFPADMKIGDKFKDQTIQAPPGKGNFSGFSVVMHRSVAGQEMVSTPAGKWNCFKIAQTTTTTIPGRNGGAPTVVNDPTPSYTWFAPEMGIIKMTMGQKISYTLVELP